MELEEKKKTAFYHIQHHFHRTMKKVKTLSKRRNNLNFFILAISTIMVRRGIWGILDMYLFPSHKFLSFLVSILIGIAILLFYEEELDELH